MKTYLIYDSKLKDGLRKKINDESITLPGDWNKAGADAAKRMGLTFTLTGRYALGLPVAKISGDRQKLIKYVKKWYDPDFFEDGYDLFDSKVVDSKLKDVRLEKGDWFTFRGEDDRAVHGKFVRLYKVININSHTGYSANIDCECYIADYNYAQKKFTIRKDGKETILNSEMLSYVIKFNSGEDAVNWLRRQVKIGNINKTRK